MGSLDWDCRRVDYRWDSVGFFFFFDGFVALMLGFWCFHCVGFAGIMWMWISIMDAFR
jgi:hypothetical protein